ncbi:MAG: hypothetical protein IPI67_02005 [Myxococcales bacterium]|nr:hypothetical protein [Myxococcales bacterium]
MFGPAIVQDGSKMDALFFHPNLVHVPVASGILMPLAGVLVVVLPVGALGARSSGSRRSRTGQLSGHRHADGSVIRRMSGRQTAETARTSHL